MNAPMHALVWMKAAEVFKKKAVAEIIDYPEDAIVYHHMAFFAQTIAVAYSEIEKPR